MIKSIRAKLVISISLLVVVVLGLAAIFLISQKESELKEDLFRTNLAFAQLTAPDLVDFYNLYLKEDSFVYFNRELKGILNKNQDIEFVKIYAYDGKILYDSETESEQQYFGENRRAADAELDLVQSQNIGLVTDGGQVVFGKYDQEGSLKFVDRDEQPENYDLNQKLQQIYVPMNDAFSIVYGLNYQNFDQKILAMQMNILLLAGMAIIAAIVLGWFIAIGITRPLKRVTEGAGKIALGNFEERIEVKGTDETATLAKTFNQMAQTLAITTKAMIYEERVKKELEIAANIQKSILPKMVPKVSGLDISAGLIPAEEIGGDCYDFLPVGDGKWNFYLGDVTGHGVPSGIVVSIANALFFAARENANPQDLLTKINFVLKEKTTANMFLTLVLMQWDENSQNMKYISAGHEPILHFKAASKTVEVLKPGGLALGMISDISNKLELSEIALENGDFLVVYSDGIPEAWRSAKDMYGMERLKRITAQCRDLNSATAIRNAILADVKQFAAGYKQMDDITLMILKKH